jgi:DNA-binding beta-propeller fold protein YncE
MLLMLACVSLPGQSGKGLLLVANQGDRSLSVIDPASAKQVDKIAEDGITGHEAAVYPAAHEAFVPIYGNSGVGKPGTDGSFIDIVDLDSRKVVNKIDFGRGVRPHCAVFDKNSNLMYVTTEIDKSVAVIDPRTLKIVGSIPTGQPESHMLVISHDGAKGYTANVGPGTVSVLDMKARKKLAVIPISGNTQRISISTDDKFVFTADQTKPQMAVIDTATNKVTNWIALPGLGYGTASTKDGNFLLVAVPSLNQVAVIDLKAMKVVRTVDVGKHPSEILVRPDGEVAYVACQYGHGVAPIELKGGVESWKAGPMIEAADGSDGLAWAE